MALTPSAQIALRAHLATILAGRDRITLDQCLNSVRRHYPIMGLLIERRDIALALRTLRWVRDRDQRVVAYRHRDVR